MQKSKLLMAIVGLLSLILAPSLASAATVKSNKARPQGQLAMPAPSALRAEVSSVTLEPKLGYTSMGITGSGSKVDLGDGQTVRFRNQSGYSIGLGLGIPMTSSFTFETGLHFIKTKFRSDEVRATVSDLTVSMYSENEFEHLALPALGRFCFSGCSQTGAFVRAGIVPTYLTGGKATMDAKVTGSVDGVPVSSSYRVTERLNDGDFTGLNALGLAGAGFRFTLGPTSALEIDANYARGLFKLTGGGSEKIYHHGLWAGAVLSLAL